MTTISVTGHRPDKLGGYLFSKRDQYLEKLAREALLEQLPDTVISGMALGWDTAIARAAVQLGFHLIAAVPFVGQEEKWSKFDQGLYQTLLTQAQEVKVVCEGGYAPWKLVKRNFWMVDNSDSILALWNGDHYGGTFSAISYAQEKEKPMLNLWPEFSKWAKSYQSSPTKLRKFERLA